MAFWDDLDTTYSGEGVFTGTYGAAPYRQFIIEWRAHRLGEASRTSNFEIIFNESNGTIRTVYGATTDDGNGATLRLQQNALTGTQCACNGTGSIFPGLRVDLRAFEHSPMHHHGDVRERLPHRNRRRRFDLWTRRERHASWPRRK